MTDTAVVDDAAAAVESPSWVAPVVVPTRLHIGLQGQAAEVHTDR